MASDDRDGLTKTEQHVDNLLDTAISLKDRAKQKIKMLSPTTQNHPASDDEDEDDIFSDAAFDPAHVLNKPSPKRTRPTGEAIKEDLKSAAYLAVHPRKAMRTTATRIAAEKLGRRHPLLTLERDQELVDAHDAFDRAVSSNASDTSDLEEAFSELDQAQTRVEKVERQRESLQTAWVLSRHVSRVKVVRPNPRPAKSQFRSGDRLEWERYLGHLALYYCRNFTSGYIDDFRSPPFDLEDLARIIERIALTSAPWQSFLVRVRRVYTWADPKETSKWLALYCILWYTQYIVSYFYFHVIYSTLRNRFRQNSVKTVRESVGRAIDRETRVQAWGELIQRHGQHDWLEPFLDEIGPIIQLQLGDLADMFEILTNFHRWERPELTLASLFFFFSCLLVSLCASMEFCVKLISFLAGCAFFLAYPIATNYPKYRLLVSPWRWMLWGVPTYSQLAILSLQEKAAVNEAEWQQFDYRDDPRPEAERKGVASEYSFKVYHDLEGKSQIIVDRKTLTLAAKLGVEKQWPFTAVAEIRKLDDVDVQSPSTMKTLRQLHTRSAQALQFLFLDETELTILLHPADRDRVFNLVLAWSGLKWQCLLMDRHNTLDSERSNLDRAIKRALK